MDIIRKYGKQAAIGFSAAGLICLVFAFFIHPGNISAQVWVDGADQPIGISPDNPIAGNWLMDAGIKIFPGDGLMYSGVEILPSFNLPISGMKEIVFHPAFQVDLLKDGKSYSYTSSAETIGESLWEQGIMLKEGDELSLPFTAPLEGPIEIELNSGKPIRIHTVFGDEVVYSASKTVAGVLEDAGIELQDLDYAKPGEHEAVPANGIIEVVRVSEANIIETSVIAYTSERMPDPEMGIGEEKVLQSGQNGVITSNFRIRYENGEEISRTTEQEWVSKQPISQKTAYGTQVVMKISPEGLNYWLTKEVYITSYRDTGNPTASGIWPYYGAIAVSPEWYSILKGSSIYVPGYGVGTVLDVCPGCVGKPWIDVFIPTEDYVSWSHNETVYFLAPVPSGFSGDLP